MLVLALILTYVLLGALWNKRNSQCSFYFHVKCNDEGSSALEPSVFMHNYYVWSHHIRTLA